MLFKIVLGLMSNCFLYLALTVIAAALLQSRHKRPSSRSTSTPTCSSPMRVRRTCCCNGLADYIAIASEQPQQGWSSTRADSIATCCRRERLLAIVGRDGLGSTTTY